jgi:hypothetical protein
VADLRAERDGDRPRNHAKRDEAVDTGVIAVADKRRAREPPAGTQPHLCRQLVAEEADSCR